jgi:ribosomal protein L37E
MALEMSIMQLPIKIKLTKKCKRCGLRYPAKEESCTHCTGLSDKEVEVLKEQYQNERAGNANLGWLFLFITALIVVAMIVVSI